MNNVTMRDALVIYLIERLIQRKTDMNQAAIRQHYDFIKRTESAKNKHYDARAEAYGLIDRLTTACKRLREFQSKYRQSFEKAYRKAILVTSVRYYTKGKQRHAQITVLFTDAKGMRRSETRHVRYEGAKGYIGRGVAGIEELLAYDMPLSDPVAKEVARLEAILNAEPLTREAV